MERRALKVFVTLITLLGLCGLGVTAFTANQFTLELTNATRSWLSSVSQTDQRQLIKRLAIYGALALDGTPVVSALSQGLPLFLPGGPTSALSLGEIDAVYVPVEGEQDAYDIYVFVPADFKDQAWAAAAKMADRYRKDNGVFPRKVVVFQHELTVDRSQIQCTVLAKFNGTKLFTTALGYHEQQIQSADELVRFLETVDDLVYVNDKGEALVLGGRDYGAALQGKLDIEDIAALYRACFVRVNGKTAANPFIQKGALEETDKVSQDSGGDYYYDAYSLDLQSGQQLEVTLSSDDFDAFLEILGPNDFYASDDDSGAYANEALGNTDSVIFFVAPTTGTYEIRAGSAYSLERGAYQLKIDLGAPGFSLDPGYGPHAMQNAISGLQQFIQTHDDELQDLADQDGWTEVWDEFSQLVEYLAENEDTMSEVVAWIEAKSLPMTVYGFLSQLEDAYYYAEFPNEELWNVADQLLKLYYVDLDQVKRKLAMSDNTSAGMLGLHLTNAGAFQYPRFTGNTAGTKAGMTLFYCDLLAKLWSFGFSTPASIGMPDSLDIPISSNYWEEIWAHPEGRLWFGERESSARQSEDRSSLFLDPLSVSLYARSSNPYDWLDISEEVEPTEDLAAYIEWWERHWEEIIRYEPQYSRLNQLMKWSSVISWLLQNERGSLLSYLVDVRVNTDYEFQSWYESSSDLSYRADLPFASGGALHLIESETREVFGQNVFLSGGVTLADRAHPVATVQEEQRRWENAVKDGDITETACGFENRFQQYAPGMWTGTSAPVGGTYRQPDMLWVGEHQVSFQATRTGATLTVPFNGTSWFVSTSKNKIAVDFEPSVDFYTFLVCKYLTEGKPIENLPFMFVFVKAVEQAPDGSWIISTPRGLILAGGEEIPYPRAETGNSDTLAIWNTVATITAAWSEGDAIKFWNWNSGKIKSLDKATRDFLEKFHEMNDTQRSKLSEENQSLVEQLVSKLFPPRTSVEWLEHDGVKVPSLNLPRWCMDKALQPSEIGNDPLFELQRWLLGKRAVGEAPTDESYADATDQAPELNRKL